MSHEPKKPMTKYVIMLLAANDIEAWWGRAAHVFGWILLQGYVVFPSTFSAYNLADLQLPPAGTSLWTKFKREVFFLIRHIPLFGIAWGAVIIGAIGMSWCLLRWRRNYVWGLREVITPGLYAASTGLVSTVANVWGAQKGDLSASSKLTLFVTGGATGFFTILWIIYKPFLLANARKKHVDKEGHHGLGEYGEGCIQTKEMSGGNIITNVAFGSYINSP